MAIHAGSALEQERTPLSVHPDFLIVVAGLVGGLSAMASAPLLTALQFKKIELHLPASRRDRRMISAILYRASSGQSVREAADAFGVTKTKLNEWERALAGELPGIMQALRLEVASSRVHRRGGQGWQRTPNVYDRVTALQLEHFGAALRRTAR